MKIAILHPDLGIGGAERLIVDAALAIKSKGHKICFFTSHHDPNRCFDETKDGSFDTVVVGSWLPRNIFGKFTAWCAYMRMVYAAIYITFFSNFQPDLILCDIVSVCIPVFKFKNIKVIFYCHFPDQLLTERKNWLKRFYRIPLDWLEEETTGLADVIVVNSNFTAKVFRQTFTSLKHLDIKVIYPTIDASVLLRPLPDANLEIKTTATTIFLSINRYERKKNVLLAIEALNVLKQTVTAEEFSKVHLIIAGGYDDRLKENVEHFEELNNHVENLELQTHVSFLKSPNDDAKRMLLHCCTAVLYTPSNEHFGIVPLEAMLLGRPVIACSSGGPLETVLHEQTGYLCNPNPESFAEKMALLTRDRSLARELGTFATEHVRQHFAFPIFASKINNVITEIFSEREN